MREPHELLIDAELAVEIDAKRDQMQFGLRYVSFGEAQRMERAAYQRGKRNSALGWIVPAIVTAAAYTLGALMQAHFLSSI